MRPAVLLIPSALVGGLAAATAGIVCFRASIRKRSVPMLDLVPQMVFVTNEKFIVQRANSSAIEASGYDGTELHDKPVSLLFQPSEFEALMPGIQQQLASSDRAIIGSITMLSKYQKSKPVTISIVATKNPHVEYSFFCTTLPESEASETEHEVTEALAALTKQFEDQQHAMLNLLEDSRDLSDQLQQEKTGVERQVEERTAQLNAEHARLDASINSLDVGFLIVDTAKHVLTTNKAYTTIVETNAEDETDAFTQLQNQLKDSINLVKVVDTCILRGKKITKDNLRVGELIVRLFIAPIFDGGAGGKALGAVLLLEDISVQKATERSRDEFFSIASHELRTPLTAIRGNISMILDFYSEQISDPPLKEMVDDILDSSTRLISIVNDFLDMSRLEQSKIVFELTEFSAIELVDEVIREFTAGAMYPKLYLKYVAPKSKIPLVHADRDRLKQTIINLVGNALKFTDAGGVTIKLAHEGKAVKLTVSDSGKGIPKESQSLLFRKFQQASNNILTRDSTRSTGLGLYISKLIVEGMSGKIYLESSVVGKGSTFAIEVPAVKK